MHSGDAPHRGPPFNHGRRKMQRRGGDGLDDFALLWNNLLWFSQVTGSTYGHPGKVAPGARAGNIHAPTAPAFPVYRTLADSGHSPDSLRSLAIRTLRGSSGPSQDCLDRGEAWIFRLAHYGEQLEPAFIIRPLHEVANSAGGKIGHGHRRRRGASLDPGGNDRVERREHGGGDIRAIEIGNKIAEHGPPCSTTGDATPPALSTERIAYLDVAGDCCAAEFQSRLCPDRVLAVSKHFARWQCGAAFLGL